MKHEARSTKHEKRSIFSNFGFRISDFRAERGFTLIELLVVTAVLTIISGLLLANNNRFGGIILLENLAYDVALSVREAQVYGISVRQFGSRNFQIGYGMHFAEGSPTTYVLFADAVNENGLYDGCPSEASCELVESTDIGRGYRISKLCAPAGDDYEACSEVEELDIVFQRPEPDAFIRADGAEGLSESARIVVESPRGDKRSVIVEVTGQIATE